MPRSGEGKEEKSENPENEREREREAEGVGMVWIPRVRSWLSWRAGEAKGEGGFRGPLRWHHDSVEGPGGANHLSQVSPSITKGVRRAD